MNAQKLIGMTQGARKRRARKVSATRGLKPYMLYEEYHIGQRLRSCLGCSWCGDPPREGETRFTECDGSGVLPAKKGGQK